MNRYLEFQKKVRGVPCSIVGNPYALISDGIVTDVVYMQNYDNSEIKETLKKYNYEEYVICSEYGQEIYVGERKIGNEFLINNPFPSWEFSAQHGYWMPPVSYPKDNLYYDWDENVKAWVECVPCNQKVMESTS